jgi:hypothetical protein
MRRQLFDIHGRGHSFRVARFFLTQCTKTGESIPNGQWPLNYQMYKIAVHIPKGQRKYQPFPLQGPQKFTEIGIFSLKIYHLATLHACLPPP